MIAFPHCKINLGLHVLDRRPDGYHNISTCFFPLPLKDALELSHGAKAGAPGITLTVSGLEVPGDPAGNLCQQAYKLLKKDFPSIPAVRVHLLKGIPAGAGLGGGSSDGAATLILLNRFFELGLSADDLLGYALQLGSDCPFFIFPKPCVASGRGEQMHPVALDLTNYFFVVVCPPVHVSTAWAFDRLPPERFRAREPLEHTISLPVEQWQDRLVNEFEQPVFAEHSILPLIRDRLRAAGAVYASLTGTGSAIYGIFPGQSDPDLRGISEEYPVYNLKQNR